MYPDTFIAPTVAQIASIRIGDFVKICEGGERFWAIITQILVSSPGNPFGNYMVAKVDNDLIGGSSYSYGDELIIRGFHVYDVYDVTAAMDATDRSACTTSIVRSRANVLAEDAVQKSMQS